MTAANAFPTDPTCFGSLITDIDEAATLPLQTVLDVEPTRILPAPRGRLRAPTTDVDARRAVTAVLRRPARAEVRDPRRAPTVRLPGAAAREASRARRLRQLAIALSTLAVCLVTACISTEVIRERAQPIELRTNDHNPSRTVRHTAPAELAVRAP